MSGTRELPYSESSTGWIFFLSPNPRLKYRSLFGVAALVPAGCFVAPMESKIVDVIAGRYCMVVNNPRFNCFLVCGFEPSPYVSIDFYGVGSGGGELK